MNLSEISIRKPVFAWMLMAGLILFGWISFRLMGISQLPDVDFPTVSVALNYEGAAPEVMETDVIDPIEDSVMTVQGIRNVSSYSRYGQGTVSIEFDLGRDIDAALQEVQTKIAQAQRNLPKEMDPPIVTKTNPEDQPILWLTFSSDHHQVKEIMRYTRDVLKDKFSTVPGVGEIFLAGYVEPNLRVWTTNHALDRYELSIGDLLSAIRDEHSELPGGQIESERRAIDVRTMGEARSTEEFGRIVINGRGGRPNYRTILLKDVAQIEEGLTEVRRISRFNGKPAVGLGIRKQRGSNAVEVARAVKKRMAEVNPILPKGMVLAMNFDTTKFIEESVGELNFTLVLSAILTALVCWMFLGSWSSTFNVLLAIPTSIIGSFIILHFAGFTLNTFTLLGLSLAIGIVVDDAIMVLENIVRHREKGESRMDAALNGSRQITFAAIAATIAIVAIFLPVAFMRGVIGRFFFQFGVTMTVTVLLSLLEALTLTPMRCSKFVEAGERTTRFGRGVERAFQATERVYRRGLALALAHRWKVVAGSLVFFAASFASVKGLNKEFVPAQDQGSFLIRIETPIDASLTYTDGKFREAEKFFASRPEVDRFFVAVGGGIGGAIADVNSGIAFVTMKEKGQRPIDPEKKRELTQLEFMDVCRQGLKKIPEIKSFIQDLSMRGFSASRGFPLEFSVRGPDWNELARYSQEIKQRLEKTGLVTDLDTDYKLGKPEVHVVPDRTKAAQHGVSIRVISETVSALVGGVVTGKYPMGGHRYDIRVRLSPDERGQSEQIRNLFVRNNRGELVRLSEVVTIEEHSSLQQIARYDRERAVSIYANITQGKSQAAAIEAVQEIAKEVLPGDYHAVMSGSAQTFKESFQDLIFALIMGIIVAYMVLASQFNSFIDPITVLMALPFSISGAFLALYLSHQSLNIYSFIGLILLMGIVKKNSILLVEFTNQVREESREKGRELPVIQALLDACPVRLRPIMMTSLATIAGAVPPALAIGPGAETRIPMAIGVIGGVLVSTVLTLFVVPCAYSLFAGLSAGTVSFDWKRFSRKKASQTQSPTLNPGASPIPTALIFGALIFAPNALYGADRPAPQELPLTVGRAVQIALEKNPRMRSVTEKIQEQDAQVSLAASVLFPTVTAGGSTAYRKDPLNIGNPAFGGEPYNLYNVQFTGTQPLFHWGLFDALGVAKKERTLSEIDREIARRDLILEAVQAFYTTLLGQSQLEMLEKQRKLQETMLGTAERRLKIGRGQLLDLLQIRTQLALLEPRLAQARTRSEVSAAELANLMGRRESEELVLILKGDLRFFDWKAAAARARTRSYRLLELERIGVQQDQLSDRRSATLGKHYPSLDLAGTWGRQTYAKTDLLDEYATFWNVGFQLSIPIFSGLSSVQERKVFAAQDAELGAETERRKNDTSLAQVRSLKALETQETVVESAKRAFSLADQSLREAQRNFRLATIDYVQFLSIEKDAVQAESDFNQAKFDYIQAAASYFAATGLDLSLLIDELDPGQRG